MKKLGILIMAMFCFFVFSPTNVNASAACSVEESGIPERPVKACYSNSEIFFQNMNIVAYFLLAFSIIPFVIGVKKIFKKDATKEEINTGYWYCCCILIPIGIYLLAKFFEHFM